MKKPALAMAQTNSESGSDTMWRHSKLRKQLSTTCTGLCIALGAAVLMTPLLAGVTHAQSSATVTSGMGGGASSTARLQAQVTNLQNRLAAIEACGAKSMLYGGSAFGGTTDADDCVEGMNVNTSNYLFAPNRLRIGSGVAPSFPLDVAGSARIGGDVNISGSNPRYIISNGSLDVFPNNNLGGTHGLQVHGPSGSINWSGFRTTSDIMEFAVNSAANYGAGLVLDDKNNVGVGGSPNQNFDVKSDATFGGNVGIGINTATAPIHVIGNGIITGNLGLGGVTAPSTALDVTGDGTFSGSVNAGSFFYTSDASMKENIRPVQGGLETVGKLRPVTFKWKGRNETSPGFIAQEVEQVIPEIVRQSSDGIKSVDYAKMVAHLVAAVQEQQAEIDALKKQVNALK